MDIEVGDKVTYIDKQGKQCTIIVLEDKGEASDGTDSSISEILKIERPKYEVVEEKKELLTEQEKEFLKLYMQFTNIITNTIYKKDGFINFIGYTVELALYKGFDKLIENKLYTLKELGLEEN